MTKTFVHVSKKDTFLEIANYATKYANSIVFIKDTQEIWTHDTFYGIPQSWQGRVTNLETSVAALNEIKGFSKVSDGTTTAAATGAESTLTIKGSKGVKSTVSDTGITIEHINSVTAGKAGTEVTKTVDFSGTIKIPSVSYDAQGHVTTSSEVTVTLPNNPNTDTSVTAVDNHYVPTGFKPSNTDSTTALGYSDRVITGVTKDAAGHIIEVTTKPLMATPTKATVGLNKVENLSVSEILASDAVTQVSGTNNLKVATTEFVQTEINKVNQAVAGGLIFRGTIGSTGATVTALPATHTLGDVYIVKTAGTFANQTCEVGDMIICTTTGATSKDSDWNIVQTNINGAVTAGSNLITDQLMVGDGNKIAKPLAAGSNGQVLKIVDGKPAWESDIDTDTTYTFENGTDGSFSVTPSNGSKTKVSIGKPSAAGEADTAAKLATGRKVELTGGVTGSVASWDGSGNLTIATTLANHASNKVTVMTGYTKANSPAAISATDSLNTAVGKLEAGLTQLEWEEL